MKIQKSAFTPGPLNEEICNTPSSLRASEQSAMQAFTSLAAKHVVATQPDCKPGVTKFGKPGAPRARKQPLHSCFVKWAQEKTTSLSCGRGRSQRVRASAESASFSSGFEQQPEDIVIVGAGISGLATALALHKVGIRCVVLEQRPSLGREGTSITLWGNGWRALDVLGVADGIRDRFTLLEGVQFLNAGGRVLKELKYADASNGPHEVRNVERRELLGALAAGLPAGAIRTNSKVVSIEQKSEGCTQVELEDGSRLNTKVLLGCDGANSVVGKWMKLGETKFVGQGAIRGLASYPDGHKADNTMRVILGQGVRVGYIPNNPKQVYWFVCFDLPDGEPKITDPSLIRQEALTRLQGFPSFVTEAVHLTASENLARSSLRDRWTFPYQSQVINGVTVAGDAAHPMTPNLGQGGCCALEDSVILARQIHQAFTSKDSSPASIAESLESFSRQRWQRKFPLVLQSYMMGLFMQSDFPPVSFFRDKVAIPLVFPDLVTSHTVFDCGQLPVPAPSSAMAAAGSR